MKSLLPLLFAIPFFFSCSKGEKNDFDSQITYAKDFGIDPATGDTIYLFAIPSGFTPNADGINDLFYANGFGIKRTGFSMGIYSRNKNLIFYSQSMQQGWDGAVQGRSNISPMEMYDVDITLTDTLGISHRYLHRITLLK